MRRLWLALLLLPLTGCPKSGTATYTWTGTGNPQLQACGTKPCLVQYVIKDANGNVVATPAIGTFSYKQTITTVPTATYTLSVTAIDANGNMVSSPQVTASPHP